MSTTTRKWLDTAASILLRCWLIGFALMLFSLGAFQLGGGKIDEIHGKLFGLTPHELDLIIYCGMGLMKLCVIMLFFIPWIAIKLVLRKAA